MAPAPGNYIGPYQILGPIGAGGMGQVYNIVMEYVEGTTLADQIGRKGLPWASPEWIFGFSRALPSPTAGFFADQGCPQST